MNPLTADNSSASGLGALMNIWGEGPRYVAVKNFHIASDNNLDECGGLVRPLANSQMQRVLASGGAVIELKKIDAEALCYCDMWECPLGEAVKKFELSKLQINGWRRREMSLESFIEESFKAFGTLRLFD